MLRRPGAVVPVVAALLALTGVASAGPRDAELGRLSADGPLTLSATRDGVALLHGERLLPGQSVTGMVTLTNLGEKAGTLELTIDDVLDTPGALGGRLSNVMRLRLEDLTSGRAPIETALTRSAPLSLGTVPGGQGRTYRVTALFPDGGRPAGPALGDNLLKGSRIELALRWQLSEDDPVATPTPAPTQTPAQPKPKPTQPKPAPPVAPPAVTPAPGPTPAPRPALVHLRVPAQRVIKPRKLAVYAMCEVKCKLRFSAKIDNAPKPAKKGKKAKKRKTLMAKRVVKKEKRWYKTKRIGREQRFWLKLTPKALERLKRQLRLKGRVGITLTAKMRSSVGNRTVRRRIVMRTYKKGERAKPAPLR
jgi:hypothetical protein